MGAAAARRGDRGERRGKTTVATRLAGRLSGCQVFDVDLLIDLADVGWDRWREAWLRVAHGVGLNRQATVLCGPMLPEHLDPLPTRRLLGPVSYILLDCADDVRAQRLQGRAAWRSWTPERIDEHLRFAAALRRRGWPTVDTTSQPVEQVVMQVAALVKTAMSTWPAVTRR